MEVVGLVAEEPRLEVEGLVAVEVQPPHGFRYLVLTRGPPPARAATTTIIAHRPPPPAGPPWLCLCLLTFIFIYF